MPFEALKRGRDARGNPTGALHRHLVDRHLKAEREWLEIVKREGHKPATAVFSERAARMVTGGDLLAAFLYSSLDVVGMPSAAWMEHGFSVGVVADVDIGKLILPGWGTLNVAAGVKGERTTGLLLVALRQASRVGNASTKTPVVLLALNGVAWRAGMSASVSAGVKAGFTVDAKKGFDHNIKTRDELDAEAKRAAEKKKTQSFGERLSDLSLETVGLGTEASATVSVGGGYQGTILHLVDSSPSWHAGPGAETLKRSFEGLIGKGDKAGIKSRASAFFTDASQKHFSKMLEVQPWYVRAAKFVITKGRIPFANLEEAFDAAEQFVATAETLAASPDDVSSMREVATRFAECKALAQKKKDGDAKGYEADKKRLKPELDKLFEKPLLEPWKPARHFFGGNPSLEEYTTALDIVGPIAQVVIDERARQAVAEEVAYHRQGIKAFKAYLADDGPKVPVASDLEELPAHLCRLDLWGHNPEVRAGVECKVSAKAIAILEAHVGANASASKSWKFTHYRFQHYQAMNVRGANARAPQRFVVTTQDTSLRYSQTVLTAGVEAKAMGVGVSEDATRIYHQMSYESATARWIPAGRTVTVLEGSGYSFGQSFTLKGLHEAVEAYRRGEDEALTVMAERLDIKPEVLEDFCAKCWVFQEGGNTELHARHKTNVVLVEAVFAAPRMTLSVDTTKHYKPQLEDFRKKLIDESRAQRAAGTNLESIRLRYRQLDATDNSAGFTLGIPVKPVKIGIELQVVERAGSSGIIDIYTRWYNARSGLNEGGRRIGAAGRDDETVPPVSIFHQ